MKQPDDVRRELSARWDRELPDWAQASVGIARPTTSWPLAVPLGAPTEAAALHDVAAASAWVRTWLAWTGGGRVRTVRRSWRSLGPQTVPTHLELTDPRDVARAVGAVRDWDRLTSRLAELVEHRTPDQPDRLDRRTIGWLAGASEPEWQRVLGFLRWVEAHPISGLLPRQLPIAGVDSKWFEQHRRLLTALHRAVSRSPSGSASPGFGLREVDREIAVRVLDPGLATTVGGLTTFSASAGQLARLSWTPPTVLVCENLQTALSFDEMPGTVVLSRQGYAVDVFGAVPWLRGGRVLYWGDLDTHGFAILNRVRSYLPGATSVLMDTDTLTAHRDLWVTEEKPTAATLPLLTEAEQAVYGDLVHHRHGDRVRLEQERVGWDRALDEVRRVIVGG